MGKFTIINCMIEKRFKIFTIKRISKNLQKSTKRKLFYIKISLLFSNFNILKYTLYKLLKQL